MSPGLNIGGFDFVLAFILACVWIWRRKKIRRNQHEQKNKRKGSYKPIQIFGILGIIFLLLPFYYIVSNLVVKGILLVNGLILVFIGVPEPILFFIEIILEIGLLALSFVLLYLLCELCWPKKQAI